MKISSGRRDDAASPYAIGRGDRPKRGRQRARPYRLLLLQVLLDVLRRLRDAFLGFDEREAHVTLALFAEADARRQADLGLDDELLAELERAHSRHLGRDLPPGEHRSL